MSEEEKNLRQKRTNLTDAAAALSAIATEPDEPEDTGPARGKLRASDSRERAAKRVAALRDQLDSLPEGNDEFYLPLDIIPDGWSYEWKRYTVLNAQDPSYQVALAQTGWEAVPASRHPDLMPLNWDRSHIERKGMILMERPLEITQEMKRRDDKNARDAVRQKAEQLGQAPAGHFERTKGRGVSSVELNRGYESGMLVPE